MHVFINEKKAKYINEQGQELLSELIIEPVIRNEVKSSQDVTSEGHLKYKKFMVLDNPIGPIDEFNIDFNDRKFAKFRVFENEKLGFDEERYKKVHKVAKSLLAEKNIGLRVSESFLVDSIFDWVIDTHKESQTLPLSDYVIAESNKSVEFVNVYIPVLYLECDNPPFIIGMTVFSYMTDGYIQELAKKLQEDNREGFIESLTQYSGQFYAHCCIEAERAKAIEIATKQIILSIDTLRLFSPTVEIPEFHSFFDLDMRNIHQNSSHILVQPLRRLESVGITLSSKPKPFVISAMAWKVINEEGLKHGHDFILKTIHEQSELDALIHNAVGNFSKAISNFDLHERVVQLFTVLESLLLPNDNSPIIDSVCKYLPKIITKDAEQRKLVVANIKEMYKIRSSVVHHAQKKSFSIEDLRVLQICSRALIVNMIILSYKKQDKLAILREIDERINLA